MRGTIGGLAALAILLASPAEAVVSQSGGAPFQSTASDLAADPTAAPAEQSLPNVIGTVDGQFLVTAVGPKHVLSAKHVNRQVGASIVFEDGPNAGTYTVVSTASDPDSDLRLLEIDGVLLEWAELYDQLDESGKVVTVFGRGRPAGDAIVLEGILPILQPLKGWRWGTGSVSEWTWGRNIVSGSFGDPQNGPLLEVEFDRTGGMPRECHMSAGDSSGPWFLPDPNGAYRLAGVQSVVLGPFQLPSGGPEFNALILDFGGLILDGQLFPDAPNDFPSNAGGVRISARLDWLQPLLDLPDGDGDGVPDALDNCSALANADQTDTDGDDYGNACDCDFDQSGACNIDDFNVFLPDFSSGEDSGAGTDMDGSGKVNIDDFNLFLPGFTSGSPGPSGLVP